MGTSLSSSGSAYYSVRQVAWLLGVEQWRVYRAIRRGVLRPVRRRSRLVVPAWQLQRLLVGGDE